MKPSIISTYALAGALTCGMTVAQPAYVLNPKGEDELQTFVASVTGEKIACPISQVEVDSTLTASDCQLLTSDGVVKILSGKCILIPIKGSSSPLMLFSGFIDFTPRSNLLGKLQPLHKPDPSNGLVIRTAKDTVTTCSKLVVDILWERMEMANRTK